MLPIKEIDWNWLELSSVQIIVVFTEWGFIIEWGIIWSLLFDGVDLVLKFWSKLFWLEDDHLLEGSV
jgi:hypothetical protein